MNDETIAKRPRKRWKRVLKWSVVVILAVVLIWFQIAYWTSTNDCGHMAALKNPMKAFINCDYGLAHLKLENVEKPVPNDDQVLVRVHAVSVNPYDWHVIEGARKFMRAVIGGLRKPKDRRLVVGLSGTVDMVGKNVTQETLGVEV